MHKVDQWLTQQLNQLTKLFPNATIFFVSPSIYFKNKKPKNSAIKIRIQLQKSIDKSTNPLKKKIVYIEQPFFISSDKICDTPFHGNVEGRKWRTHDLYQRIAKYLTH